MADATCRITPCQGLRMTRLLASVRSTVEAKQVLSSGADIIDCKNPADGALGALSPETILRIVNTVAGERPVSATAGNILNDPRYLYNRVCITGDCGVDYVKAGLFEQDAIPEQLRTFSKLAKHHALIAVCFADRPFPSDLLARLADSGVQGVMVDTAGKRTAGLTELWPFERIAAFIEQARAHRLMCGIAGRLRLRDIPPLLSCHADYLGFRSALCAGCRSDGIDELAMMRVRQAIPFHRDARVAAATGVALH